MLQIIAGILMVAPLLLLAGWLFWRDRSEAAAIGRIIRRALWPWLLMPLGLGLAALVVYVGQTMYMRGIDRANARTNRMRVVYQILEYYEAEHGRPANGPDDLAPYAFYSQEVFGMMQRGEIVVLWGRPVQVEQVARVVLAHEPPSAKGATVFLWSDGSISREDAETAARLIAGE